MDQFFNAGYSIAVRMNLTIHNCLAFFSILPNFVGF